jgi:aryl-alcohol dehydrogenase-like predicted oxidoreductase
VGWPVSEVGYGMWGMGGWTGSDDEESLAALSRAIMLGCTFFDTAWAYGQGKSERLLAEARRRCPHAPVRVATKIPPKNMRWPARAEDAAADAYPADHIREYTEISLRNLDAESIDLQQFHVWSDTWADDDGWKTAVRSLKEQGLVSAFGISVNRWQPTNVMRALETGLIAGGLQHLRPGGTRRAVPLLPGSEHCGHRPGALRRGQPDRYPHAQFALARGRLAEYLLHT